MEKLQEAQNLAQKQLSIAQSEARHFKSQLAGVANMLGIHILGQTELFATYLVEIGAHNNLILQKKKNLDLLFHSDKGLVSEIMSNAVKQKLNLAYSVLGTKTNREFYIKKLNEQRVIDKKKQMKTAEERCVALTKLNIEQTNQKLRKELSQEPRK